MQLATEQSGLQLYTYTHLQNAHFFWHIHALPLSRMNFYVYYRFKSPVSMLFFFFIHTKSNDDIRNNGLEKGGYEN